MLTPLRKRGDNLSALAHNALQDVDLAPVDAEDVAGEIGAPAPVAREGDEREDAGDDGEEGGGEA